MGDGAGGGAACGIDPRGLNAWARVNIAGRGILAEFLRGIGGGQGLMLRGGGAMSNRRSRLGRHERGHELHP